MNTVTNIDVTVHSAPEHHAVQVRMNVMWCEQPPFAKQNFIWGCEVTVRRVTCEL